MTKLPNPTDKPPVPGQPMSDAYPVADTSMPPAFSAESGDGLENPLRTTPAAPEPTYQPEATRSRPVETVAMGGGRTVTFTRLRQYAPHVAPGREPDPIPDYLADFISRKAKYDNTYQNTIAVPGWQNALYDFVVEYLNSNPNGRGLANSLGIHDTQQLAALTPEQAVKLSTTMVRALSKYTRIGGEPDGSREDEMTAMQLLEEGLQPRDNETPRQGNGVCRNITSNVRAMFEALKACQREDSMLRNTYCVYMSDAGIYVDQRAQDPHAYPVFVTVDSIGSADITITDVTLGLEDPTSLLGPSNPADHGLAAMDQTTTNRVAGIIQELRHSDLSQLNALATRINEMLEAAWARAWINPRPYESAVPQLTNDYLIAVQDAISTGINLSGSKLPEHLRRALAHERRATSYSGYEIGTLHALQEAGLIDFFDNIWTQWIAENTTSSDLAELFSINDDTLNSLAATAVGDERLLQLASGDDYDARRLRAGLQELRPDLFPPLDHSAS